MYHLGRPTLCRTKSLKRSALCASWPVLATWARWSHDSRCTANVPGSECGLVWFGRPWILMHSNRIPQPFVKGFQLLCHHSGPSKWMRLALVLGGPTNLQRLGCWLMPLDGDESSDRTLWHSAKMRSGLATSTLASRQVYFFNRATGDSLWMHPQKSIFEDDSCEFLHNNSA